MEIKVGEYVRNKEGKIIKTTWVGEAIVTNDLYTMSKLSGEITKHSPNIIDLIEVGDYVNGCLINYMPDNEKAVYHDASDCMDVEKFENKDIETIVTKEQFKGMEYKV